MEAIKKIIPKKTTSSVTKFLKHSIKIDVALFEVTIISLSFLKLNCYTAAYLLVVKTYMVDKKSLLCEFAHFFKLLLHLISITWLLKVSIKMQMNIPKFYVTTLM